AGNRLTQTDARGITATYGYDALNRLTSIAYPTAAENVSYTYDASNAVCGAGETFAVGRLSRMTDPSGTTEYCYDRFGNTVRKMQTTAGQALTVRYAYTASNRLRSVTYPDGSVVDYVRDAQARISEVGVTVSGASRQVLLSGAGYYPMGPSSGWQYGNGRQMQRVYDNDYRARSIRGAGADGLDLGFGYDPAGRLTQLKNAAQSTVRANYRYDPLERLLAANEGATTAANQTYSYDATGNRLTFSAGADATQAYVYPATSHRLGQVDGTLRGYDANGNTVQVGGTAREYVYNDANRLAATQQAGVTRATYRYNARGEQVLRSGATHTVYVYDEAGMLLGQYGASGAPVQQYVWMEGLPVGVISANTLHYVEADHLGTPRAVIDPTRQRAIWTWDLKSEPFGNTAPAADPDGDGTAFAYDLRFPGQRYDALTGLNYNYFRDYEPSTGRYVESDPIGLLGGINTYAYVGGNPVNHVDPFGLCEDKPKEDCMQAALNTYLLEESANSIVGFGVGTALFGGPAQVVNKTAIKPRGGVAGGGPSGQYTSYSRRFLGNGIGKNIGRAGIGTAMRVTGILGAGLGAFWEHAEAIDAFLECRKSQ
ncbi:MAG TPA: RHS repeat-associated core domain-containing protein, partial [Pseudoxanthomonas sp.]|nr:RHS repeat-associated core domain-containing protein [Pseudoxanthomonas sp.]